MTAQQRGGASKSDITQTFDADAIGGLAPSRFCERHARIPSSRWICAAVFAILLRLCHCGKSILRVSAAR
ncbi:MAG: hypothetical protein ACYSOW_06470, partial [Planctomycetota bacterium]